MAIDVTSALQGFTASMGDLYEQIDAAGWYLTKVHYEAKEGHWKATANNPHGEEITKSGTDEKRAVANLVLAINRRHHMRSSAQHKVGMWSQNWTHQLQPIAEAYAKANVYEPKAAIAFTELGRDSIHRASEIGKQLHVEVTDHPEPYRTAQEMNDDIRKKRHIAVSRANIDHPVWSADQHVAFRLCHDVLGHAASGGDFGWHGKNLAVQAHMPLLSEHAQKALFSQAIAHPAYHAHYRGYGPQKIALFPQFMDSYQQKENPAPGHGGLHPSQIVVPFETPSVKPQDGSSDHFKEFLPPHLDSPISRFTPAPDAPDHLGSKIEEIALKAYQYVAHNKKGVFIDLRGEQPRHGYAYCPTQNSELKVKFTDLTPTVVDRYVQEHLADLQAPDNYLAIWKNGSHAVIDVGRVTHEYHIAYKEAYANNQPTMWDLDHDEAVPVHGEQESFDDGVEHEGAVKAPISTDDPNLNWDSGEQPMNPMPNIDHDDPFDAAAVSQNASLIIPKAPGTETEWSQLNQENPGELAMMKQAIVNAFRVVLLSPRKDLKWNAQHYQDIAGVSADVTDPGVYWHTLEQARQNWNVARFGEGMRYAHIPYYKKLKPMEKIIYEMNPTLGDKKVQKRMSRMLVDWKTEEENAVMAEDRDKPEHKQRLADEIDRRANARLTKRMAVYIAAHKADMDNAKWWMDKKAPERMAALGIPGYPFSEPTTPEMITEDKPEKYGAFMGTHLKSISQISQHVDEILKAALEDVHDKGHGYIFRSAVMRLKVSGVGPKVCSFAWLLLQPMTSQLATIDTHMMDVLGGNFEKDLNNRDYFKYERMLAAGRDAAGYSHVPLGQFQWGMWDLKRTGQGSHQDHSAMKVLGVPTPVASIDWAKKEQPIGAAGAGDFKENWLRDLAPDWWQNTQPARDRAKQFYETNVAPNFPKKNIPFGASNPLTQLTDNVDPASPQTISKIAAATTPWFTHPTTGLHTPGGPGQTIMQHATRSLGLSTPQVWVALGENAGKS